MGNVKQKFEELVKEFTFEQFYELCKIFEVDIVDRQSVKEATLEALKNKEKVDLSEVKMRRDFDNMTNELVASYYGHNRQFRRKADQIINKVIKANRTAKKLRNEYLIKQYNAGIDNIKKAQQIHLENLATIENPEGTNSADMAAEPLEG